MGKIVQLPLLKENLNRNQQQPQKLETQGDYWVFQEKKLLDYAEFFEAMILVLDEVRLQNIRSRDYAMMEIVSEEIPLYQKRLEETQVHLASLRRDYSIAQESLESLAN